MAEERHVREAVFIERPNRFLARMMLDGNVVEVFVPNPGRMHEMMIPGKKMFVRYNPGPQRRTDFSLVGINHDGVLVSLDSYLPNRFLRRELEELRLPFFSGYDLVEPEPSLYDGRFDFRLSGQSGTTLIEVKSCTLVEDGLALFPDAPTSRGARHMRHLARALEEGSADRAAVVFVIQRPDAHSFSTNDPTDPDFGETLRTAQSRGVEIIPLSTRVVGWNLELVSRIPYVRSLPH